MSEVRSLPIGDRRITTPDVITVRSPFDGHERRRGAERAEADEVDAAVAAADAVAPPRSAAGLAARRDPRHAPRACSRERTEEFARIIAEEAAKPIKTARVEAQARGVDVHVRRGRGARA